MIVIPKSEAEISEELVKYIERRGAECLRLHSGSIRKGARNIYLNKKGLTDRLFIFPYPEIRFVEIKAGVAELRRWYQQTKDEAPHQLAFMRRMAKKGWPVHITISIEDFEYQRQNNLTFTTGFRHETIFDNEFTHDPRTALDPDQVSGQTNPSP